VPDRPIALHRHIVRVSSCAASIPAPTVRVLAVARLVVEKGLDVLLRAIAQVLSRGLDCRLEIAGDGPLYRELNKLSCDMGLVNHVMFSRGSSTYSIHRKMCQADVFVLASRTESMPFALLEAMSHGLAIVATSVGGVPEVVTDGETGLLVPPESADSLAEAIGRLLADDAFRAQLGRNARQQFQLGCFSEVAAVSSVLASYEKAKGTATNSAELPA
jgi:glycosyltransferase involved in cell wall biosynthesis